MIKKLYMNIGISGSGKSWYLKNNFINDFKEVSNFLSKNELILDDIIISPDNIRREFYGNVSDISKDSYVWKIATLRLQNILNKYGYGIFDATGVSKKGRKSFLKNYKNVYKIALVFEPNVNLSKKRISNDINEGVDRSNVPNHVVDRQFKSFSFSVMNDRNWNGDWNKKNKTTAYKNLKQEFDEIYFK